MPRSLSPMVVLLVVISAGAASGQAPPVREGLKGGAASVFELLCSQASLSYMGKFEYFEEIVASTRMKRVAGGEALGTTWARWEGADPTGRVVAFASFPDGADKKYNDFWVSYQPPNETPMPQALLAHLLAKAESTSVAGGDSLEMKLSSRSTPFGCQESTTLRVRLATGALLLNSANYVCPTAPGSAR